MKSNLILIFSVIALFLSCDKEEPVTAPSITLEDVSIPEGNSDQTIQIVLKLSEAAAADASVDVITREESATDSDFEPVNTTVLFDVGATTATVDITIKGDEQPEEDEWFQLVLTNPSNVTISDDRATITLLNDDGTGFAIPTTGYVSADSYPGMSLVWEENFQGAQLDPNSWTFELGDGCDRNLCGWGNNELQYYRQENTSLVDGHLVIEAKRESIGGRNYTSSRIVSQDKQTFQYGRIDIRAVMPEGQGLWPALWMLGNNISTVSWPECGEIDIMEMVGGGDKDSEVHGTAHWGNNGSAANFGGSTSLQNGKLSDEFHVYSIEWTEDLITWYFDDVQYHAIDITPAQLSEFRGEFFFIMNVAVGGNWPGSPDNTTVFPQWMIVDYIKVFQAD